MEFSKYTTKDIQEVLEDLKTSLNGLSEKEVLKRQKIYGLNEIKIKEIKTLDILFRQFKSSFFYLLFIATIIYFLIGQKTEGWIILIFITINVLLGFIQEYRAEKAALLLRSFIPEKVRVLRQGKEKIINKKFLVPGDIVLLKAGDIVPADLRIVKIKNLLINEEILTGESTPPIKTNQSLPEETKEIFQAKNILFAGSSITTGEAEGIVINTGKETVFGKITKLVAGVARESAYEKNLLAFSRLVLKIVVTTIIFVFLANFIIRGTENFLNFLVFSLALIVSIVPEALPVIVTFSLSEGALKLAKEKVVVKRLAAIEDLGNIEILCTDKTGTLTENKLHLENIYSPNKEKCLLYGLLVTPQVENKPLTDPFDLALFEKSSSEIRQFLKNFKKISEIPFDPFRRKNSALLKNPEGEQILIVRGAPETILDCSSVIEGNLKKEEIEEKIKEEGKMGKRTLAIAFKKFSKENYTKKDEKDLIFLGYFSFSDPLKESAREAIQLAEKLGVKVKILTGDSKEVAGSVAKEIGLIKDLKEVILEEKLESLSEENFEKACQEYAVFARISPEIKFKIVKALEKKFEVGFLGEGVNDAPALKAAHVAVAVESAADISKEVSDIIILKKDLNVLVKGIKRGRNIFANINKYIKCTLASNFGNFYSMAAISFFITFLPMLPVQILLLNLLSDFPLIAIATDTVDVEELRRPKFYQLHQVILLIVFLALVSSIFDFIFFSLFIKEPTFLQTFWFILSILTEISLIFIVRTRYFFLRAKRPSFPLIILSFSTIIITILLPFTNFGKNFFHFVTPPTSALFTLLFLATCYFVASEIVKLIYFRYWKIKTA